MARSIDVCAVFLLMACVIGCETDEQQLDSQLEWAITTNDVSGVKTLLSKGANPNNILLDGWTAFSAVARDGRTDLVRIFIEKGFDVNARMSGGQTPLHWAARNGHRDVVHLLLESGADPCLKDNDGLNVRAWSGKSEDSQLLTLVPDCKD